MPESFVTRTGVSGEPGTYDIKITGPAVGDTIGNGGPIPLDFTQKCIGVGWPSGIAIYAAADGSVPGFGTITVSTDGGATWLSPTKFFNAGATCGIAGTTAGGTVLVVGGFYQALLVNTTNVYLLRPQFYISTNKGKSWTISRPAFDTSSTNDVLHNIIKYTTGFVSGVGYDPGSKTFYAVVQQYKFDSVQPTVATQRFLSGGAGGFGEISSQPVFTITGVTPFTAPPQAPWPSGASVNDLAVVTDDAGNPGAKLVYATAPNQSVHYCAVNVDPQHLSGGPLGNATVDMSTQGTLSSTVGGTSTFALSGTLTSKFLLYVDSTGAIHSVPIDPSTTSGGVFDPSSNVLLGPDPVDFGGTPYYTFGGELSSVLSGAAQYATVSFSAAGNNTPT